MQPKVRSFLELAREDLNAARTLQDGFPRQAAFHLQQAAEKVIKAVLSAEGITGGSSHQLGYLVGLLPAGHDWRADLMVLDKHTSAATSYRYPAPGGAMPRVPNAGELGADIQEIERLLPEVRDWCAAR